MPGILSDLSWKIRNATRATTLGTAYIHEVFELFRDQRTGLNKNAQVAPNNDSLSCVDCLFFRRVRCEELLPGCELNL